MPKFCAVGKYCIEPEYKEESAPPRVMTPPEEDRHKENTFGMEFALKMFFITVVLHVGVQLLSSGPTPQIPCTGGISKPLCPGPPEDDVYTDKMAAEVPIDVPALFTICTASCHKYPVQKLPSP